MSKAIGLMLVLVGGMLGAWFVYHQMQPGVVPLPSYIIAAMAVAMLSVGIRYMLKKSPKKPTDRKE